MKNLITVFIVFFSITAFSQKSFTTEIDSRYLGESRNLKIYLPEGYERDSLRLYPLAVVFDADYLFDLYVGNSVLFSQKEKAPKQIVVGIQQENKRRYQDCAYNLNSGLPENMSDSFYKFVRAEVLDYMELNYRVSPFKTIVGNTLTANFTNYFLIEDEPGFDAFININPYYAPQMASLVLKEASKEKKKTFYYYIGSGDYLSQKKIAGVTKTDRILSKITNKKFHYKIDEFNGSDKISSIGQSISGAMSFVFNIFSPISKKEYETKLKDMNPADAIAYLEDKYVEIEYLFGANIKMREKDIYRIEPIVMEKENGEYLRDLGEMVYRHYPESPLSDYYIGMDYEMRQKYEKAADAYKEGYMKFDGDPQGADQFYQNVERVENKMTMLEIERGSDSDDEDSYEDDNYDDDQEYDEDGNLIEKSEE